MEFLFQVVLDHVEQKERLSAIEFARTNNKPFFGICLGLQLAIIEFARHKAGIKDATSMEFSDKGDFVIHYMAVKVKTVPKVEV